MSELKAYIQSLVAEKLPDAFTLRKTELPRKIPTGIRPLDRLIQGFQRGNLTEIHGHGSSGRTTMAVSFLAEVTRRHEVCALVDVSDALDPESLSAAGADLNRLLWIRCGKIDETLSDSSRQVSPYLKQSQPISNSFATHESSFSSGRHPRHEVRGLSHAIATLMGSGSDFPITPSISPRWDEGNPLPVPPCTRGDNRGVFSSFPPIREGSAPRAGEEGCAAMDNLGDKHPQSLTVQNPLAKAAFEKIQPSLTRKSTWSRLEQAMRVTDLLLNNGGFGAVVLDLGDVPAENARRIPLTSWFRFRRSVESTPTVLLLLSNEPCGGTCASLVLHCQCRNARWLSTAGTNANSQVLTLEGMDLEIEITRCRGQFQSEGMRHSSWVSSAHWQTGMS
jgi:recombination protein RecA